MNTNDNNSVNDFLDGLPFEVDDFQKSAMETVASDQSVVVCAPTGSGKTLIAEYAVFKALAEGKTVFYTTPLKALSNQKYYDFQQALGAENVGLLTGDRSSNRDARVLVMTTEIFRNMLYGDVDQDPLLNSVGYVILDECHYMNDAQRGTVWEESIIYCPKHIQLVALSATVKNAQELTDWMSDAHRPTQLAYSDYRPVPLRFFYFDRKQVLPLFERDGTSINRKLKTDVKGNRFNKKQRGGYEPNQLLDQLYERDMLPAIIFTFSRAGCDKALKNTTSLRLTSEAERALLGKKIDAFIEKHPFIDNHPQLKAIRNGFAAHHAGLLPALKTLVESLFQEGLIKAVFATETLAAGINMPARTTVITSLSKRVDEGHRMLNPNEFLQMSGRAGRRGMDTVGNVVIVSTPFEGATDATRIASSPPDPLNSQFTPTYGMVLNLLQRHTLEQAEYLINKSFGQFTWKRRMAPLVKDILEAEQQINLCFKTLEEHNLTESQFKKLIHKKRAYHDGQKFIRQLKTQLKRFGKSKEILEQLKVEENKKAQLLRDLEDGPTNVFQLLTRHRNLDTKLTKNQKNLKRLKGLYEREKNVYWRSFTNIYELLKHYKQLNDDNQPSSSGLLTSQLRAENELLLTLILEEGLLNHLSPETLAGVCCALTNDSNRDNLYSDIEPSPQVFETLGPVIKIAKRLNRKQQEFNVDIPIALNAIASGLVESWAQGLPWRRIMDSTNLTEGDLVRMMRRTCDLLRQFSRADGVPEPVADSARKALPLLLKDPIKELETLTDEALKKLNTTAEEQEDSEAEEEA